MTPPLVLKPDPRLDLVLERVIDVPRELVWAAWTKPEHLSKWFTPAPWTVSDCEIDLRPAFDDEVPVGWCQLTPRDDLPRLDRTWRLKRVDDLPVWSLSCFYVRKGHRRQGVTSALIAAAVKAARQANAPALEAYPLDAGETPSASGTGYASTFARAGFTTIARRVPPRPIMRHDLE